MAQITIKYDAKSQGEGKPDYESPLLTLVDCVLGDEGEAHLYYEVEGEGAVCIELTKEEVGMLVHRANLRACWIAAKGEQYA